MFFKRSKGIAPGPIEFLIVGLGNPGKNYLCEGYRMFFRHIAPYMDFMKKEYMNQRPPSNVMQHIQEIEDSRK